MRFLFFLAALWSCCFLSVSGSAEIPRGSLPYAAADTQSVRQQKAEYNKAYWTLFSLIASSAAYAPSNGIEAAYLRGHGWDFSPHRITDGKTTVHFLTAKGIMAGGKPLYVIAFRGSADKKDWTADFVTGQVVYGGKTLEESEKIASVRAGEAGDRDAVQTEAAEAGTGVLPKVHKGFNTYADLTLRMLLTSSSYEFLEQFRREKDADLLLTGHSLGGAVATIVGQRLIDFGFDPERLQVITVGAPAVANKTFKEMYGSRMNLIRVTNSEDPVPLTFQAVLRNYRQFGEELRFRIPRTFNNMNHFLNLYLDAGLRNYYQALDAAADAGIIQQLPDVRRSEAEKPTVLLYVEGNDADKKKGRPDDAIAAMDLLDRFMLNEYKELFPNYAVVRSPSDPYQAMEEQQADYLLQLRFEADTNQYDNSWFLTVEQTLSDKERNVLTSGSAARRTSPRAGNIRAAMEVTSLQKAEVCKQMSWLQEDTGK